MLVLATQGDILADDGFGIALELVVEQIVCNQVCAVVRDQSSLTADCAQPGIVAVGQGEDVGVQPDVACSVAEQALAIAHHLHIGTREGGIAGLHVDARISVVQNGQAAAGHFEADAGQAMGLVAAHVDIGILDVPVSGIAGITGIVEDVDRGILDVDVHVVDCESATIVVAEIDGGIIEEDRVVVGAMIAGIEGVDIASAGLALHARCGHGAVDQ